MTMVIPLPRGGSIVLILCASLLLESPGRAFITHKYDGYKVLRVHPSTAEKAAALQGRLADPATRNVEVLNVRRRRATSMDMSPPSEIRTRRATSMDISVPPSEMQELLALIEFLQIPHETLVDDLRVALDFHADDVFGPRDRGPFSIFRYNTYDEITAWLHELPKQHSQMVEVIDIGKSWENRPIYLTKLQAQSGGWKKKPAIWLDGGIHSNEWIGPATMIFYINELLSKYGKDESITDLLDSYNIYILPLFNVDGYVHTWDEDRLWRKTRSHRNESSTCVGVDMNRNWPYKWGVQPGVSTDPCSVIYGGPEPESEPEVRAVIRYLKKHRDVIKAYVAFHSYSQMWMMPFSYSSTKPKTFPELEDISEHVVAAIQRTNGEEYTYGTVMELLGEASGSSVDYTYAELGIKYSFGVELRDDGFFGSLLPPNQIAPTALETLEGIKVMARMIKDRV